MAHVCFLLSCCVCGLLSMLLLLYMQQLSHLLFLTSLLCQILNNCHLRIHEVHLRIIAMYEAPQKTPLPYILFNSSIRDDIKSSGEIRYLKSV